MKDNADKKNLAKYKKEIANLTDRGLLEEKAYFTFATYRVLEKIHTIAVIFLVILLLSVLLVALSYLTSQQY